MNESVVVDKNRVFRFADLFSGLGGTRLGVEQACLELDIEPVCVFSCDKKKAAAKAYKDNFGTIPSGDITRINVDEIPNVDMVTAGFPCQPFSIAGARRGFSDTRGTMFFEVERILASKKPTLVLLENVEGLVSHDGGRTLETIIKSLENIGYSVSYRVLDSSDFGVPQKRRRLFIIGVLGGGSSSIFDNVINSVDSIKKKNIADILECGKASDNSDFATKLLKRYPVSELYGKVITDKRSGKNAIHSWDFEAYGEVNNTQKRILCFLLENYRKRKYANELGVAWRDGIPLNIEQIERDSGLHDIQSNLDDLVNKGYLIARHPYVDGSLAERFDLPVGYKLITARTSFHFNRILDPNGYAVTLTASDANRLGVIDSNKIRGLTKREMLRLFGFPDNYSLESVSYKEASDLCGNSICVPVVAALTKEMIKDWLKKNDL